MAHITTPLPRCISAGSEAVPSTMVDIIRNPGGYDVRIQRRSESLRRFNVAYQLRKLEDVYDIIEHFEVCEGPLNTFPLLDRTDWKSSALDEEPTASDVLLGTGDGASDTFQLRKKYVRGSTTKYRTILLPIVDSVLIAVDGTPQVETTDYIVNYETGIITFQAGSIPGTGQDVTAGFKFYCKVRFDTNDLSHTYEGFRVGQVGSVPLIEVRI